MAKNNTLRLLNLTIISYSGRMAQWYEVLPIALEEVGLQVYITAGLLPVFWFCFVFLLFSFIVFLPFGLFDLLWLSAELRCWEPHPLVDGLEFRQALYLSMF